MAAHDVEIVFTLDAFTVVPWCGDINGATADNQASAIGVIIRAYFGLCASLDTLRRGIIGIVDMVGIACIICILCYTIIIIKSARSGDRDITATDGHQGVAFHAFASWASGSEWERAATDVDVAVGIQTASRFRFQIFFIPCADARCGNVDHGFIRDVNVACAFYAFGGNSVTGDGDSATADIDVAWVFVLVVGGDACRCVTVEVALDAIVIGSTDVDGSTFHEEVLVARDAIAYRRSHVDGGILDADVFTCLDAVFYVAHNVKCTFLLELSVSLYIKAAFLRSAGSIDKCIGGARNDLHVDTLAILDMDGGTTVDRCSVGQSETIQFDSGFVGTWHVKLTVGWWARKRIGDFAGQVTALRYWDVCPALRDGEVIRHVVGHGHGCWWAVVNHGHTVIL